MLRAHRSQHGASRSSGVRQNPARRSVPKKNQGRGFPQFPVRSSMALGDRVQGDRYVRAWLRRRLRSCWCFFCSEGERRHHTPGCREKPLGRPEDVPGSETFCLRMRNNMRETGLNELFKTEKRIRILRYVAGPRTAAARTVAGAAGTSNALVLRYLHLLVCPFSS